MKLLIILIKRYPQSYGYILLHVLRLSYPLLGKWKNSRRHDDKANSHTYRHKEGHTMVMDKFVSSYHRNNQQGILQITINCL